MIEATFRKMYQLICIEPLLSLKFWSKIHPHFITCMACLIGIATLPLLAFGFPNFALSCLVISGFLDTLDGSLARQQNLSSPQGAALDIICDRIVEFAIVLGLNAVDPVSRGMPALLMLGSILICVTSFLIVGIFTSNSSEKSFHYSPGLMERAEAFIAFSLMILFPSLFHLLAYLFCFLVLATAVIRMAQFFRCAKVSVR